MNLLKGGLRTLCTYSNLLVNYFSKYLISLESDQQFSLDRFSQKAGFRIKKTLKDLSVTVYQNADMHKLLHDLYVITRKQISDLRDRIDNDEELSTKEMRSLDACLDGVKKLIGIERELKTDALGSMTDDELRALARKTLREGRPGEPKPKSKQ